MVRWLQAPPKPVRMEKGVLGRWKEKLLLMPYMRFIVLRLSMVITHFGATVKSMSRFKELVNRMVGWKKVMSSADIRLIGMYKAALLSYRLNFGARVRTLSFRWSVMSPSLVTLAFRSNLSVKPMPRLRPTVYAESSSWPAPNILADCKSNRVGLQLVRSRGRARARMVLSFMVAICLCL